MGKPFLGLAQLSKILFLLLNQNEHYFILKKSINHVNHNLFDGINRGASKTFEAIYIN
jgi:hypothetical protein